MSGLNGIGFWWLSVYKLLDGLEHVINEAIGQESTAPFVDVGGAQGEEPYHLADLEVRDGLDFGRTQGSDGLVACQEGFSRLGGFIYQEDSDVKTAGARATEIKVKKGECVVLSDMDIV
jgi:hypothetical protein